MNIFDSDFSGVSLVPDTIPIAAILRSLSNPLTLVSASLSGTP